MKWNLLCIICWLCADACCMHTRIVYVCVCVSVFRYGNFGCAQSGRHADNKKRNENVNVSCMFLGVAKKSNVKPTWPQNYLSLTLSFLSLFHNNLSLSLSTKWCWTYTEFVDCRNVCGIYMLLKESRNVYAIYMGSTDKRQNNQPPIFFTYTHTNA